MATYSDGLGFNYNSVAYPAHGDKRFSFWSVQLDFADIVAARSDAGATALAAADVLQVIRLPAGTVLLQGGLEVVSAESTNTTATFDLGFTGGSPAAANVFGNDVASNSAAITATGLAAPVLISADDSLDLLINTAAPTDAVLHVWCFGVNVND